MKNVKRILLRCLDFIRLILLTRPLLGFDGYQPLSLDRQARVNWLHLKQSRGQGTRSRYQDIQGDILRNAVDPRVLLDVGANSGGLTRALSIHFEQCFAIDSSRDSIELISVMNRLYGFHNINTLKWKIHENTVDLVPHSDVTLVLSIWHHWVRDYGIESASRILQKLFEKTSKFLYFDTGSIELPAYYQIYFANDEQIKIYLEETLHSNVRILNTHQAFGRLGGQMVNASRTLFVIDRNLPN
jgi:hypothetical protein